MTETETKAEPVNIETAIRQAYELGRTDQMGLAAVTPEAMLLELGRSVRIGELNAYRRFVRETAERWKEEAGWCDAMFGEAMQELGLPSINTRRVVTLKIRVRANRLEMGKAFTDEWIREQWDQFLSGVYVQDEDDTDGSHAYHLPELLSIEPVDGSESSRWLAVKVETAEVAVKEDAKERAIYALYAFLGSPRAPLMRTDSGGDMIEVSNEEASLPAAVQAKYAEEPEPLKLHVDSRSAEWTQIPGTGLEIRDAGSNVTTAVLEYRTRPQAHQG
jgi:hypothetical protein